MDRVLLGPGVPAARKKLIPGSETDVGEVAIGAIGAKKIGYKVAFSYTTRLDVADGELAR
jgi:hypothetical protein